MTTQHNAFSNIHERRKTRMSIQEILFRVAVQLLPSTRLISGTPVDLPQSPGIYIVLQGDRILYIGASANMRARWRTHQLKQELKQMEQIKIAYMCLDCEMYVIFPLENELIRLIRPPLNSIPSDDPPPCKEKRRRRNTAS